MHPLKEQGTTLDKPYVCVRVRRSGNRLTLEGNIGIAKPDTYFADLPANFEVLSGEGEVIKPMGRFRISTQTVDPYHLLIDWHSGDQS